jgi:hypothetical protein
MMLDTKLILIEGLPGSGKSTSTVHLGTTLQQRGIACRWFQEDDDPHPIACLDFEIKDLPQKMIPLWAIFTKHATQSPTVTIIECRLWQNTALFMYMSEVDVEEILKFSQQIWRVLAPLAPVLVYLDHDHIENTLRQLYTTRGEKWMEWALETTTQYPWFQRRGLRDFAGWVQFFEEWQHVAARLYDDWPHTKIRIQNPHDDWSRAYQQMEDFLHITPDHAVLPQTSNRLGIETTRRKAL